MATNDVQVWKSSRFSISRDDSSAPDSIRFSLSGPFTARDMYSTMAPTDFRSILAPRPGADEGATHVFDLSEVPYMDSTGLGLLVSHYSHCQRNGVRFIVDGAGQRVLELFRMTKVDKLLTPDAAN